MDGQLCHAHLPGEMLTPRVGLVIPERNWTYPYDYYLIYPPNHTISGTHFEPDRLAGSRMGRLPLMLNTSSFRQALEGLSELESQAGGSLTNAALLLALRCSALDPPPP